jgi:inner membrane protein
LLDYTTICGTQLFWPLLKTPFGTGHMFIIDPLYTVPLIVGVLWHWRRNWLGSAISLALSSAYLLTGLWTQQIAYARALADLGPLRSDQKLLVVAAPLTILMHRAVLREKNGYREAYVSLVADQGALRWERFVSEDALIADLSNAPASAKSWQRLRDFSHGFVALERITQNGESHVIASDLRMGSAPHFVFSYDFGPPRSPHSQVLEREAVRPDLETIKWVYNRILTPAEELPLASQVYGAKAQN